MGHLTCWGGQFCSLSPAVLAIKRTVTPLQHCQVSSLLALLPQQTAFRHLTGTASTGLLSCRCCIQVFICAFTPLSLHGLPCSLA